MKHGKFGSLILVVGIMIVALVIPTGCVVSVENTLVTPGFEELGPPPIEVTVDQLYAEFIADQEAAMAKYEGQRLSFIVVTVEDMSNSFYAENPTGLSNFYVLNGFVKFKPRYVNEVEIIRRGFVVDIVGEVKGLHGISYYSLIVDNCWINVVEGDIGAYYGEAAY